MESLDRLGEVFLLLLSKSYVGIADSSCADADPNCLRGCRHLTDHAIAVIQLLRNRDSGTTF